MKKTYIAPTVTTTIISTENLIAASPDGFNSALGTSGVGGGSALIKDERDDDGFWDDWGE